MRKYKVEFTCIAHRHDLNFDGFQIILAYDQFDAKEKFLASHNRDHYFINRIVEFYD